MIGRRVLIHVHFLAAFAFILSPLLPRSSTWAAAAREQQGCLYRAGSLRYLRRCRGTVTIMQRVLLGLRGGAGEDASKFAWIVDALHMIPEGEILSLSNALGFPTRARSRTQMIENLVKRFVISLLCSPTLLSLIRCAETSSLALRFLGETLSLSLSHSPFCMCLCMCMSQTLLMRSSRMLQTVRGREGVFSRGPAGAAARIQASWTWGAIRRGAPSRPTGE